MIVFDDIDDFSNGDGDGYGSRGTTYGDGSGGYAQGVGGGVAVQTGGGHNSDGWGDGSGFGPLFSPFTLVAFDTRPR